MITNQYSWSRRSTSNESLGPPEPFVPGQPSDLSLLRLTRRANSISSVALHRWGFPPAISNLFANSVLRIRRSQLVRSVRDNSHSVRVTSRTFAIIRDIFYPPPGIQDCHSEVALRISDFRLESTFHRRKYLISPFSPQTRRLAIPCLSHLTQLSCPGLAQHGDASIKALSNSWQLVKFVSLLWGFPMMCPKTMRGFCARSVHSSVHPATRLFTLFHAFTRYFCPLPQSPTFSSFTTGRLSGKVLAISTRKIL